MGIKYPAKHEKLEAQEHEILEAIFQIVEEEEEKKKRNRRNMTPPVMPGGAPSRGVELLPGDVPGLQSERY